VAREASLDLLRVLDRAGVPLDAEVRRLMQHAVLESPVPPDEP
jgi:hypothetical protein